MLIVQPSDEKMVGQNKTKRELSYELSVLRQRVTELETTLSQYEQMNQELEESQIQYRALFENAQEGTILANDWAQ